MATRLNARNLDQPPRPIRRNRGERSPASVLYVGLGTLACQSDRADAKIAPLSKPEFERMSPARDDEQIADKVEIRTYATEFK